MRYVQNTRVVLQLCVIKTQGGDWGRLGKSLLHVPPAVPILSSWFE